MSGWQNDATDVEQAWRTMGTRERAAAPAMRSCRLMICAHASPPPVTLARLCCWAVTRRSPHTTQTQRLWRRLLPHERRSAPGSVRVSAQSPTALPCAAAHAMLHSTVHWLDPRAISSARKASDHGGTMRLTDRRLTK
jgi:hypothetical protein